MPTVRMIKQRHQLGRCRLAELRPGPSFEILRHDPINAPQLVAGHRVDVLEKFGRQKRRSFDQLSVHIQDVQGAIRSVRKLHRPERHVPRRNELGPCVRATRDQLQTFVLQPSPINQIVGHVADQQVSSILFRPGITTVDRDARRASEKSKRSTAFVRASKLPFLTESSAQNPPGFAGADAEQFCVLAVGSDVDSCGRSFDVRIPRHIPIVIHQRLSRNAVRADKLPAPVIDAESVLAAAAGQLELSERSRIKNESAPAYRDWLRVVQGLLDRFHVAAAEVGRKVKPVVEPPSNRVEMSLARFVFAEAGEDDG